MKTKNWFEVDKEGLKVLQAGKPKHYILRELVQNAWDEDITLCDVKLKFKNGVCFISVHDNNPEGFKNIKDSFTLFGETYKRKLVNKRGRFNLGEKQAIALCDYAIIRTTKGSVIFNENGREETDERLEKGSIIELQLEMTEKEFQEMVSMIDNYLPPKGIRFIINEKDYPYKKPFKAIQAQLPTEIEENSIMRRTKRITKIDIHKSKNSEGKRFLYEMGIPVMEIDCEFSVDVGQKIPMGVDRETVQSSYLKDIFAVVLNETIDFLNEGNCSDSWVRIGSTDEMVSKETVKKLIKKRYGDKVVVANPQDPNANDDALAEGYRVIYGRELSKDEWNKIKESSLIPSSTSIFGREDAIDVEKIQPNKDMIAVGELAKKIAKRLLGINITVRFYSSKQIPQIADYGNGILSFNVGMLGNGFFKNPLSSETLDLIFHELGHHAGHHTEKGYHKLITKMAGESVMLALKEPDFFKESD